MNPEHLNREIAYWRDAAKRKDQEGLPAVAISFRNMAWLLEHPEGWREFVKNQELSVQNVIKSNTEVIP